MPTVPALLDAWPLAWDGLELVSPTAVPAALRIAISSDATPMATSQPKNAAPQFRPPYSSRWRNCASREVVVVVFAPSAGAVAPAAGRSRVLLPFPVRAISGSLRPPTS